MKYSKDVERTLSQWDKEYKKGFTSYVILVLLKKQTMYGYEIKNKLGEFSNNSMTYQDSGIYQILKKLTSNKLLTFKVVNSDKGPPRKYYSITKTGEKLVDKFTVKCVLPTNQALSDLIKDNYPDEFKAIIE